MASSTSMAEEALMMSARMRCWEVSSLDFASQLWLLNDADSKNKVCVGSQNWHSAVQQYQNQLMQQERVANCGMIYSAEAAAASSHDSVACAAAAAENESNLASTSNIVDSLSFLNDAALRSAAHDYANGSASLSSLVEQLNRANSAAAWIESSISHYRESSIASSSTSARSMRTASDAKDDDETQLGSISIRSLLKSAEPADSLCSSPKSPTSVSWESWRQSTASRAALCPSASIAHLLSSDLASSLSPPSPLVSNTGATSAAGGSKPIAVARHCSQVQSRYWSSEEHERFLEGVSHCGMHDHKGIASYVKTRNATQTRSHGQKFFKKFLQLQGFSPPSMKRSKTCGIDMHV